MLRDLVAFRFLGEADVAELIVANTDIYVAVTQDLLLICCIKDIVRRPSADTIRKERILALVFDQRFLTRRDLRQVVQLNYNWAEHSALQRIVYLDVQVSAPAQPE